MASSFMKKCKSLEERKSESSSIIQKYPNRLPLIVTKAEKSNVNDIDKKKFLVPNDLTVGQFIYVIRKRIKAKPEQGIFVFVGKNILPQTSALISSVYNDHKDEDGFLYMVYSAENTFGTLKN